MIPHTNSQPLLNARPRLHHKPQAGMPLFYPHCYVTKSESLDPCQVQLTPNFAVLSPQYCPLSTLLLDLFVRSRLLLEVPNKRMFTQSYRTFCSIAMGNVNTAECRCIPLTPRGSVTPWVNLYKYCQHLCGMIHDVLYHFIWFLNT